MNTNDDSKTTSTATPSSPSRRRLVAKPPTTSRQIEAARRRRDDLVAVLKLRGAPVSREALLRDVDKGDADAQQRLTALTRGPYAKAAAVYLATHERFARQEARKMDARHVDIEDLVQAARVGLLKGLDRFDASLVQSGLVTSFLSYARWWVKCEIGRALDDEALVKIPSAAKKTATELRRRLADVAEAVAAAPDSLTDEEIAQALGVDVEKVRNHRHLHLGHDHAEVRTLGDSGDDVDWQPTAVTATMASLSRQRAEDAADKMRSDGLEDAVAQLPPLQRRLVCEEYGLQVDDEASEAAKPGSLVVVKALLRAALQRLRGLLDGDGVEMASMLGCF